MREGYKAREGNRVGYDQGRKRTRVEEDRIRTGSDMTRVETGPGLEGPGMVRMIQGIQGSRVHWPLQLDGGAKAQGKCTLRSPHKKKLGSGDIRGLA